MWKGTPNLDSAPSGRYDGWGWFKMTVSFNLSKTNDIAAAVTFGFAFFLGWLTEVVAGAPTFATHTLAVPLLAGVTLAAGVIGYTGTTTA